MKLSLGRTVAGLPVGLSTNRPARVALVGTPDSGKTTACRRLVRRWHDLGAGPIAVLTVRPEQYLDLPVDRVRRGDELDHRYSLVVIDDADLQGPATVAAVTRGPHRAVVLAGWGSHLPQLRTAGSLPRPSVLLVDHRPQPQFLNIAHGLRVVLDPITAADIDPIRRRTHLGGELLDDAEVDDLLDPAAAAAWPPVDELVVEVPA